MTAINTLFPIGWQHYLVGGQFLKQPASWNHQTMIGSASFGVV